MPPGELGKLAPGLFGKLPKGVCGGDGGGDGFTPSTDADSAALAPSGMAGILPHAAAAAAYSARAACSDLGRGALSRAASSASSERDACSKPMTAPSPRCSPWVAALGGGGGSARSGVGVCFMLW